jgi:hypothetical protein
MNEHRQCKYQYQTEYVAHDPKLGVYEFKIIGNSPHYQTNNNIQSQIEVSVRVRSQRRIKI